MFGHGVSNGLKSLGDRSREFAGHGVGVEVEPGGEALGVVGDVFGSVGQIELGEHVQHEPGQMVLRQPVRHRRWNQQKLLAISSHEVVRHAQFSGSRPARPPHETRSRRGFVRQPLRGGFRRDPGAVSVAFGPDVRTMSASGHLQGIESTVRR